MAALHHTFPSKLRLTRAWRAIHRSSVPVLMFHGVLPDADASPFNARGKMISPGKMRSFLERLARMFRAVSMDEFLDRMESGEKLSNAMVITFDDGYRNVYSHAYPVLREMGLPFAVFVSTGYVDTDRVMPSDVLNYSVAMTTARTLPKGVLPEETDLGSPEAKARALPLLKRSLASFGFDRANERLDWICERLGVRRDGAAWDDVRFLSSGQIREMSDGGVTFGGHTVTHAILSRESPERVRTEVRECKGTLESITGKAVASFAYPNGSRADFDETSKRELREAGYAASFATIHGLYRPGDDPFEIRRIGVDNRWPYEELETRASGVLKVFSQ